MARNGAERVVSWVFLERKQDTTSLFLREPSSGNGAISARVAGLYLIEFGGLGEPQHVTPAVLSITAEIMMSAFDL